MLSPKVSVLVPVYNAAPYLKDTIGSVLSQTQTDFELILLDDASTDQSAEIIKSFTDPRIRYYHNQDNLGISPCRNRLMELARGEYLAVLDHDDICTPDRLAVQTAFMDNHPDISICGSRFELFTQNPQIFILKRLIINAGWIWCHPASPDLHDALKGNVVMHPTAVFRKADIITHGLKYDSSYTPAEDYDIIKQALFKGLKIANLPQILLRYNLHGNNCSLRRKQQMKDADRKIKTEIAAALNLQNYKPYPYWRVIFSKLRLKYFLKV